MKRLTIAVLTILAAGCTSVRIDKDTPPGKVVIVNGLIWRSALADGATNNMNTVNGGGNPTLSVPVK
jgi:hypothetical protein